MTAWQGSEVDEEVEVEEAVQDDGGAMEGEQVAIHQSVVAAPVIDAHVHQTQWIPFAVVGGFAALIAMTPNAYTFGALAGIGAYNAKNAFDSRIGSSSRE